MKRVPPFVERRIWWLLLLAAWAVAVGASLRSHVTDVQRQSMELATEGARNIFDMVVLTRAWVAEHGGVYVPVTPKIQPNPYLDHPRRDITTSDGQALTLLNPAFVNRLLAELALTRSGATFHLTSLNPIRPLNAPDPWERQALEAFERGSRESVAVVDHENSEKRLRYMAPLLVDQPCLNCHRKQGYRLGDIRGGISVSVPFAPVDAAAQPSLRQAYLTHAGVFLLVALAGAWLLELLRRRWLGLALNIVNLESARSALEDANLSLVRALDEASVAVRAKNAFLSNMSHELRTPMNAIIGFTYLLRRDAVEARHVEMLNRMDDATQRLLHLIDQVLDLSQLESGELSLRETRFDLDRLTSEVFSQLEKLATAKGLSVRLAHDAAPLGWVCGDRQRITQLLGHYIGNAVKFSEQGEIALRVAQKSAGNGQVRLRFEVQDQGIGISFEQQATLFRQFEQADASSTRKYGGTGLGLAVCKRLADLMGGEVGVLSDGTNGTNFWFELTLSETEGDPVPFPEAASPAPSTPGNQLGGAGVADLMDADALAGIVEQLAILLAQDDMGAAALWREHTTALRTALAGHATEFEQEINAFRFDTALLVLRKARPE